MSWDIVLFNPTEKITNKEDLSDEKLIATDFGKIIEQHFKEVKKNGDHYEVTGNDFTIDYFYDGELETNFMLSLYGENAIYAMIHLAKTQDWLIFDTGIGELLDLDNPSHNGYEHFQNYKNMIINKNDPKG